MAPPTRAGDDVRYRIRSDRPDLLLLARSFPGYPLGICVLLACGAGPFLVASGIMETSLGPAGRTALWSLVVFFAAAAGWLLWRWTQVRDQMVFERGAPSVVIQTPWFRDDVPVEGIEAVELRRGEGAGQRRVLVLTNGNPKRIDGSADIDQLRALGENVARLLGVRLREHLAGPPV